MVGLCREPQFFIYKTLFDIIGVRLPFTNFESRVLTQVKVAPLQLHLNSSAFVLSFEILMEFSLNVFFSFFQAKGVWKGV